MRLEANPQLVRAELADGHTVLGHSWDHPNLNNIPALDAGVRDHRDRRALRRARRAVHVQGRAAAVPERQRRDDRRAGGDGLRGHAEPDLATDWDPARSATQIANGIVNALRPGVAILLHDGPVDSPAGQATVDAVPLIIDAARARGYCFGTVDRTGQVVANRLRPSDAADPGRHRHRPVRAARLSAPRRRRRGALVPQPLQDRRDAQPERVRARRDRHDHAHGLQPDEPRPPTARTTTVTHPLPAGLTLDRRERPRLDLHRHDRAPAPTSLARRRELPADHAQRERGEHRRGRAHHRAARHRPQRQRLDRHRRATASAPARRCRATSAGPCPRRSSLTSATATLRAVRARASRGLHGHHDRHGHQHRGRRRAHRIRARSPATSTTARSPSPQPLQVALAPLKTWTPRRSPTARPRSRFTQPIAATDALRTGAYTKTLVFTLSTTTP